MPPRVKCAASTRDAMLESARRHFLRESYENVGLREIAGDVGVDVALVGRYFGSKEKLFQEVLEELRCDWLDDDIEADELPSFLASLALNKEEEKGREDLQRFLIILRSASSQLASEVVQTALREDVIEPLASRLSGPRAEMRAAMAASICTGMIVMRTFLRVEPLNECDEHELENKLSKMLKDVLAV